MLVPLIVLLLLVSSRSEAGNPDPIPQPSFPDQTQAKQYEEGVKALEEKEYKDAKKLFARLRKSAPEGEPREAAERCYQESLGGLDLVKASSYLEKGKVRRALAVSEKAVKKYPDTIVGAELEELRQQCLEELYFDIATFEKKGQGSSNDGGDSEGGGEDGDGDGGGGDGGRGGRGGRGGDRGGETGYGLNTKVISGSREEGTVFEGEGALEWRTGRDLSFISFDSVEGKISQYYRYLNIAIRSTSKNAPTLRLLFDCEEGNLGAGGGGQGRRGPRGQGRAGARLMARQGFHLPIETTGGWRHLRLDLRKFKNVGEVTWSDVRALRIIHMAGGEGRVVVDGIRLEKE